MRRSRRDGRAATVRVDMARVKARKDEMIGQSRNGVEKWLRGTPNVTVFNGHARFTGPHSIRVDGHDGQQHDLQRRRSLHQHRHARRSMPRHRRPRAHSLLTNSDAARTDRVARASGDRRRELYRARIRADVPPLRQPRDGAGARRTRARARGRGFRRERAEGAGARGRRVPLRRASRRASSRIRIARTGVRIGFEQNDPRSTRRICCSRPAARRIPTTSASTPPASRPTSTALIEVDGQLRTKVDGHLGDRRRQRARRVHAYVVQRLSRSSRRICSTATRAASIRGSWRMRCSSIRRSRGSA